MRILAEPFVISFHFPGYFLGHFVYKGVVGRLGHTVRLYPNKPPSRKLSPVPEKLHPRPLSLYGLGGMRVHGVDAAAAVRVG